MMLSPAMFFILVTLWFVLGHVGTNAFYWLSRREPGGWLSACVTVMVAVSIGFFYWQGSAGWPA